MLSFQEFKTNLLLPLLNQDYLALGRLADTPLTLFAAQLDRPLDTLFESGGWREVSGASHQLTRAGEKMAAILAMDGYAADGVLHLDPGSVWALVHDPKMAERWVQAIDRAVAIETAIVTVSTVMHP